MSGRGEVDDRQPAEAERNAGRRIGPLAGVVRTAMRERLGHGSNHAQEVGRGMIGDESGQAAHCGGSVADASSENVLPEIRTETGGVCVTMTATFMNMHRLLSHAALAVSLLVCVASANAQTQTVYDDFTENGWSNYSYGDPGQVPDFANTTNVHTGTKAIAFAAVGYSNAVSVALPFALGDTSTAAYPVLDLWIKASVPGVSLGIALGRSDTAAEVETQVASGSLNSYIVGGAIPTAWTEVKLNLTQGEVAYNGTFDRIDIFTGDGNNQATVYIDDISLTQAGAAAPMNPITISQDARPAVDPDDVNALPAGSLPMLSDVIAWFDANGKQRQVTLAHDNTAHTYANTGTIYGEAMREYQYQLGDGSVRIAGVTRYPGNGSHGGFGYVVNHSNAGSCIGDDSPLGDFTPYGTFTRVPFTGGHHAIFRFTQNYPRNCPNFARTIPVTIEWVFSTGRDHPLYAITYDVDLVKRVSNNAIAPVNTLFDDTRAPYGELNIDGDGFTDIDGVAWGDKFKFTSTTAPVNLSSEWTYNVPNGTYNVPYVKEWLAGPLTGDHKKDATMGLVQTQTLAQQDAGARNRYYHNLTVNWNKTSAQQNACNYGDVGPYKMPCPNEWAFQANADNLGVDDPNTVPVEGGSNNSRLTWGTAYGFLGQQNYDADDEFPINNPGAATYPVGYPKKSYSLFVVLGQHTNSPVENQVTQIETIQSLNLTINGGIGSVVTSGPAGVTRADTVTYAPPGYNHVYSALAFTANASHQLDANIAVGAGTLAHPLIIVGNVSALPVTVTLGGTLLTADTDYFASIRTDTQELWLTLNRNLSGQVNRLQIAAGAGAACTPFGTPTNVAAMVMGDAAAPTIAIMWTPVCNADSYLVERESLKTNGFDTQVGTVAGTMITDNGATPGAAYLYRVTAKMGPTSSNASSGVLATAIIFTDPNLAAATIKRVHLTQLRTAVSAIHFLSGLGSIATWPNDDTITIGSTKVRGVHVTDLRTKLDEAMQQLLLTTGGWTNSTLNNTVKVQAVHFTEIRNRVN